MILDGTTCSVKSEGAKTTQTGHTNMNLGFPEPDSRDERKSPHIVHKHPKSDRRPAESSHQI